MKDTANLAIGRWRGILRSFGVEESSLTGKHCPCPKCGGKDRFRFDDKEGRGTWICSVCGAGDGFDLVAMITGQPFKYIAQEIDVIVGNVAKDPVKKPPNGRKTLIRIADGLRQLDSDCAVTRYLKNRGLERFPMRHLRQHDALPFYDIVDGVPQKTGTFPAMVAAVRSPSGSVLSYHITYITEDGYKAPVDCPKKMMTPIDDLSGAAVRLGDPNQGVLMLAEGIETAIAVMHLTGFSAPCWAATGTSMMRKFEPPTNVDKLVIFADRDRNFAGMAAATHLAHRLTSSNPAIHVDVYQPPKPHGDFLEYLNAG